MIIQIILAFLGSFFFLFVLWKRLKEDYFDNQIFTTGFYILGLAFVFRILSYYFLPGHWFWFIFIGILLGVGIARYRFNLRFFEVLEATVVSLFAPLIMFLLYDGVLSKRASSFFAISVIALFIGLYYLFSAHYKRFTWYKSGRVGFSGLAILGLFFLTRALVALRFENMVSFAQYDWLISGSTAFLTFLTLINLSLKTK